MSYVLAIEPQEGQASVLRDHVARTTRSKLTVVRSMSAAMTAIDDAVPNLVLLSALTQPHEERHLIERLRDLPQSTAPHVLFIPALARPETRQTKRKLIDRFLNRNVRPAGCNPSEFADQVSTLRDGTNELFATPGRRLGQPGPRRRRQDGSASISARVRVRRCATGTCAHGRADRVIDGVAARWIRSGEAVE
jgi:hypothetical protein